MAQIGRNDGKNEYLEKETKRSAKARRNVFHFEKMVISIRPLLQNVWLKEKLYDLRSRAVTLFLYKPYLELMTEGDAAPIAAGRRMRERRLTVV